MDRERVVAFQRRAVLSHAATQGRQKAGRHDAEGARIVMRNADERAEELVLAVLVGGTRTRSAGLGTSVRPETVRFGSRRPTAPVSV